MFQWKATKTAIDIKRIQCGFCVTLIMIEKNVRDIIGCPLRRIRTIEIPVARLILGANNNATATTAITVIVN